MSVTANGIYNDRDVAMTFADGKLEGDPSVVVAVRSAMRVGVDVSLPGMYGGPAALDDDLSAAATLIFVLPGAEIEIDPAPEPLPEGAIA